MLQKVENIHDYNFINARYEAVPYQEQNRYITKNFKENIIQQNIKGLKEIVEIQSPQNYLALSII